MQPDGHFGARSHRPAGTYKIGAGSRLLGEVRDLIRRKHYGIRTEQACLDSAERFILFHGKRHPQEMGEPHIAAFLNHPALQRRAAASTHNHPLNALVFLYKHVLGREDLTLASIAPAKRLPALFELHQSRPRPPERTPTASVYLRPRANCTGPPVPRGKTRNHTPIKSLARDDASARSVQS